MYTLIDASTNFIYYSVIGPYVDPVQILHHDKNEWRNRQVNQTKKSQTNNYKSVIIAF